MPESRVFLMRVPVSRDDFRELERRATTAHTSRENIAAALVASALASPAGQPDPTPGPTSEIPKFTRDVWADAVRANPNIAPALLRLLGDG